MCAEPVSGWIAAMIAVIFEVEMKSGKEADYFDLAAKLRTELDKIDPLA
jgi:hypothetical protein